VTLPSSHLRAAHFSHQAVRRGKRDRAAREARIRGVCAGGSRYGAQPATPENHSFR
jgi:hypothetical protein